jgi:branched-chain amino acid transport system ATP-binding protein
VSGDDATSNEPVTPAAAAATTAAEASNVLLQATDLIAGYLPGVDILNGASLTLERGTLVGIIGPNGAGKSTFIKTLFGLVPVRSGSIVLEGDDITNLPAHKLVARGVGYVPQTKNVFPSLTIEENLRMGLYLEPDRFDERFETVTSLFPLLKDRRKDRAGLLSGGQRQMVAMGRALMTDPSVLLLDEPSAGLSPINQDEVFARVDEVRNAGVSVVMVEQNARKCLLIADTAFVLDQGRNAYSGRGRDLLDDPTVIELYLGTLARER